MIYGSETWALRKDHEDKLTRAEMRMVRWMLGVSLQEEIPSEVLLAKIQVECITAVVRRARLRWYGHVERKSKEDWVQRVRTVNVEGARPAGRPNKSWRETVAVDMKILHLRPGADAADRSEWRQAINRDPSNLGVLGRRTKNRR